MIRRSFSLRGAAMLALAALAACDSPIEAPRQEPEDLAAMVEALGFRGDMVQDFGDYVLVEGDIRISKDELRRAQPRSADPLGPRFQYTTTSLVSAAKLPYIRVDLSGLSAEPDWQNAAREALTHWSGITRSLVQMAEGGPADIIVGTTCTAPNVAAFASFPVGGNPGSTVYVNTCFGYPTSYAQKVHNMVHEFGHTLGFRHSNYVQNGESAGIEGANHVPRTPTSGNDPGSVMNGGTALNAWAGFSGNDEVAVEARYPLPHPVVTLTNSGGRPRLSWNPLPGAIDYTVRRVTNVDELWGGMVTYFNIDTYSDETVTTDSWMVDYSRSYTGRTSCTSNQDGNGYAYSTSHEYVVIARFPNGTAGSTISPAPVADYFCPYY